MRLQKEQGSGVQAEEEVPEWELYRQQQQKEKRFKFTKGKGKKAEEDEEVRWAASLACLHDSIQEFYFRLPGFKAIWCAGNCWHPHPPVNPLEPAPPCRLCLWAQDVAPVSNRRAQRLAAQLRQQQHGAEAEAEEEDESEEDEQGSSEPSAAAAGPTRETGAEVEEPLAPAPALPDDQMLRVGGWMGCGECGVSCPAGV
jgi:hypothetical protein